jgi:glutathione synthase/RimK-type ligase-like ATP-grasp enzyme
MFDPAARARPYRLVVNRVSPSSASRNHAGAIFFAQSAFAYFEELGIPIINGRSAYMLETSKALQVLLLERLGLKYPRTRVANSANSIRAAVASGLAFPLLVKPNIGGSGAGIQRFDDRESLEAWLADAPAFGIDGTVLVQEFHPCKDEHIVRVEMLGDRHLYSVRIYPEARDFNLCPADICQVGTVPAPTAMPESEFENCVVGAAVKGLRIERHDESPAMIDAARKIMKAANLDVAGIEYLVSARDGERYIYDINALSNFVRDAVNVVGFDPTAVFVDSIEAMLASRTAQSTVASAR